MIHIRYLRIVINHDIYSLFIDDISYDISSLFYDDNSYDTPSPINYNNSEDRRSSKNTHRSQQRSALHKEAKPKQKANSEAPWRIIERPRRRGVSGGMDGRCWKMLFERSATKRVHFSVPERPFRSSPGDVQPWFFLLVSSSFVSRQKKKKTPTYFRNKTHCFTWNFFINHAISTTWLSIKG